MENDGDKRPLSEPDLRKYDLAKSKNVSSRDSSRDVVAKQRERPLDLTVKGQKLVTARGQYSRYRKVWGKHLQEVESPLQEMRRLMGTLEMKQPVPASSTSQDTAQANSKIKQTQEQSADSN